MRTVAKMIEERREGEWDHIKHYVRGLGCDGLVCPGECGCSLDDGLPCGESLEYLDQCYPAKSAWGLVEGVEGPVYFKLNEQGDPDGAVKCPDCNGDGSECPTCHGHGWLADTEVENGD